MGLSWVLNLLLTILTVSGISLRCSQENRDGATKREVTMKHCIAHCLDMIEPTKSINASQTPCYYNAFTGKSQGCGQISHQNANNKVVICESGNPPLGDVSANLCDMVHFEVIGFNKIADVVVASSQSKRLMQNADTLRKAGVKLIANFVLWSTSENMMRISASADLRTKMAASILNVIEQLRMDGLYLTWMWPGCPAESGDCKPANPHKQYTVELISAISKPLKSSGRIFLMYVSLTPHIIFHLGDYYSEVLPYVDYFVLETNNQAGHWNYKPDFNFNLNSIKSAVNDFISRVKNPSFRKKLVVTFDLKFLSFELKTPTKDYKISSVEHIKENKKYSQFLTLPQWCKLVRPDSGYKFFNNTETQNYAVKEDHLFVFDNVKSLNEKIIWANSFAVGLNLLNTYADDRENECGCGSMPFIRTVAQLLKSKDCDPRPCF